MFAEAVGILGLTNAEGYFIDDESQHQRKWLRDGMNEDGSRLDELHCRYVGAPENTSFMIEVPVASRHPPIECWLLNNQCRLSAIV